jgi:hypothetical protein
MMGIMDAASSISGVLQYAHRPSTTLRIPRLRRRQDVQVSHLRNASTDEKAVAAIINPTVCPWKPPSDTRLAMLKPFL